MTRRCFRAALTREEPTGSDSSARERYDPGTPVILGGRAAAACAGVRRSNARLPGIFLESAIVFSALRARISGNVIVALGFTADKILEIQAPLYATFKFNTDATWNGSEPPAGFTLGAGYAYYALIPQGSSRIYHYGTPGLLAEINFGKRHSHRGLIKLRYQMDIGSYAEKTQGGRYVFTQHMFSFVVTTAY